MKSQLQQLARPTDDGSDPFERSNVVCPECGFAFPAEGRGGGTIVALEAFLAHRLRSHPPASPPVAQLRERGLFAQRLVTEHAKKVQRAERTSDDIVVNALFDHFHSEPQLLFLAYAWLIETGRLEGAKLLASSVERNPDVCSTWRSYLEAFPGLPRLPQTYDPCVVPCRNHPEVL